jgi:predicted transcriptional regulator
VVGIKNEEDIVHAADQRMQREEFSFVPIVHSDVRFGFDHDAMQIDIRLKNMEFAGLLHARFAVEEVTQTFLEELTKYVLDRPHAFTVLKFKKV